MYVCMYARLTIDVTGEDSEASGFGRCMRPWPTIDVTGERQLIAASRWLQLAACPGRCAQADLSKPHPYRRVRAVLSVSAQQHEGRPRGSGL